MADMQSKIRELELKINQNKMYRDKAMQMRRIIQDRNAQMQCDTEIKEYQKYIDYFSEEIRKLRQKPSRSSTQSSDSGVETAAAASASSRDPSSSPMVASAGASANAGAEKRKYSNLDLLKADTPFNKAKVSLKLHELEYKLDVEKKVLAGIKNMAWAVEKDPSSTDRRRRAEVQGELYESNEKLNLLNKAVRKYKNLYIGESDDDDDELETVPALRGVPGMRKPLTGKLQLQILEVRELAHAPTRTFSMPETIAVVKIDGNVVFRTRPSRSDKWADQCEVNVSKASDVEISIYDQSGDRSMPVGILWLKISDIVDGLRRQKIMQDNGQGWVPAEIAQQHDSAGSQSPNTQATRQPTYREQGIGGANDKGIEAWFDVEPVGHVALRINFVRDTAGDRRPLDKLGRAGAVRQRKEEVHEMNGHQFVEKSFFNIMRCALCGEFMVNSGYQCEDCDYSCHRKCYTKVVTKCISRLDSETDPDEDKLNHRIPHRFEPITNIGANWCCHCGYMLPLGSKGSKKCHECGITCHTKCAHLVPDFCGMSMEMANQMLAEIKAAKRRTTEGTGTPKLTKAERPTSGGSSTSLGDSLHGNMSQLSLQGGHQQQPQYQQSYPQGSMHMPAPMSPQAPQSHGSPQMRPPGQYNMPPDYGRPYMPQQQQMGPPPMQQRIPSPSQPQSYAPIPNTAMMPRPYQPGPSPQMSQQLQQKPYPVAPRVSSISQQQPPVPPKQGVSPLQVGRKVGLDDFNFLAVLGKGNFGKVMLAEEKYTSELYAIKVLKKRFIIDNDEVESTRSEKRVFQAANRERHPFLIGLHSCFQTETRIYFVMDYISGGDLMLHIQREQFSERRAKFYACEVLLALEYFHKQGIIYRDLKLDNILLGLDGHIRIADYGLCKENMWHGQTTGTFCGTPEFMAPEILLEQKYGRAVDWWAFGVLIYEMLLGQSPFRGEDEDEIFDAILEDEILYPINMSRDSVSICQKLLIRDPQTRLGSSPMDAQDIKQHAFFRGVNWDDMLAKRVPPPFYPSINGRADTSNFDEEFTREIPQITPVNSTLTRPEQQEFGNFSYIADWVIQGKR
ncbi:kinase-like domain-containing protein [Umbelopsis sp. AD052]|nr:kinase-like domain-containing protein [Umbelopsis sp. AD052]